MSWGKLVKVGGADSKDIPESFEFGSPNEDIVFFGRMQVDKKELEKKNFTHETQVVIPANYISATQFSIKRAVTENDADKVSFHITNLGRNPAIIDGVAIPSNTPFQIKSGSVWSIKYKKAIRLEYRFEPIDMSTRKETDVSEEVSKDETQEVGLVSTTKEKYVANTSEAESITGTVAKPDATDAMNVEESQSSSGLDSVMMQQLASMAEEKRNLEERNMKMIATVEQLQSELFDATNKITDLTRQVNENGQEIVTLKEGIRESEFAKVAVDARNVELQSQLDAMKSNKTIASTKSTLLEEEVTIMKQTVENRDIMIAKLNKAYSNEQALRSDAQKLNKEISEQAKDSIASLKAFNAGMQSLLDKEHSQYTEGLQTIRTHLKAVLEMLVLPSSDSIFPQQKENDENITNVGISPDIPYLQSFVSQMVPLVTNTIREQQAEAVQAASRVIEDVQKGPLVDLEASIEQLMEQLSRNEQSTQDYADQSQTSISAVESFAAQAVTLPTDAATTKTVQEENQFMDLMDCTQMNVEEEEEEEAIVVNDVYSVTTTTHTDTGADKQSSEVVEAQVEELDSEGQGDMAVGVDESSATTAVVGEQVKETIMKGENVVMSAAEDVSALPAAAPLVTIDVISMKESIRESELALTEDSNAQKENAPMSANNSESLSQQSQSLSQASKGKRKSSDGSQSQEKQNLLDDIPVAGEEADANVAEVLTTKKMKTNSQNSQLSTKSQQEVVALE